MERVGFEKWKSGQREGRQGGCQRLRTNQCGGGDRLSSVWSQARRRPPKNAVLIGVLGTAIADVLRNPTNAAALGLFCWLPCVRSHLDMCG
jgi:hypothetical protein